MRKLPQFMPEPSISYMDFDLDELVAASYNWCEQGASGLERDAERHPEERVNMLNMAAELRQVKRRLAEALEVMYPSVLGRMWQEEEERKINQCMAL
jgi:hypothetical protein